MKSILILTFMAPLIAFGHDLDLKSYVQLQEALASDDFKVAQAIQVKICKDLGHYKENYQGCEKKYANIEELRESFKSLTGMYLKSLDKKKLEELQVMECPMAKAKWIQKKGNVKNPYYGKSMLECGQKV